MLEAAVARSLSLHKNDYTPSVLIELQSVERRRSAQMYAYMVAYIKSYDMEGVAAKIL